MAMFAHKYWSLVDGLWGTCGVEWMVLVNLEIRTKPRIRRNTLDLKIFLRSINQSLLVLVCNF
ncbi:hypothetical protein V6Z11_D05G363900 [Gossypium hirsutum]